MACKEKTPTLTSNDYPVFSTVITPQYNSGDPEDRNCPFYSLQKTELVRIALGERFKTSTGIIANDTYACWVAALTNMVNCYMINSCMMEGFLLLNKYHRTKDNETNPPIDDTTTNKTPTQQKVCCDKPFIA